MLSVFVNSVRLRSPLLGVLFALGIVFSWNCQSTAGSVEKSGEKMTELDGDLATCTTRKDVESNYGSRCRLKGTYRLEELTTKRGEVFRTWPVVELSDGTIVLIESIWDKEARHDEEMISRYKGQQIQVVGKLHESPPVDKPIQNLLVPTVSPVQTIKGIPE